MFFIIFCGVMYFLPSICGPQQAAICGHFSAEFFSGLDGYWLGGRFNLGLHSGSASSDYCWSPGRSDIVAVAEQQARASRISAGLAARTFRHPWTRSD